MGYIRNENSAHEVDEPNFIIFQKAWHSRADGMTLSKVAERMKSQDFKVYHANKKNSKKSWL
jgi:hypothetical protein